MDEGTMRTRLSGTGSEELHQGAPVSLGRDRLPGPGGPLTASQGPIVQHLSWLSVDAFLLVGSFAADADEPAEVQITVADAPVESSSRFMWYSEPGARGVADAILTVRISEPRPDQPIQIALRSNGRELSIEGPTAAEVAVDLRTLLRDSLASLPRTVREEALEFVVGAAVEHGAILDRYGLSRSLFQLREALREPSPRCELAPEEPQGLYIDTVARLDDTSFFVRGWMRDAQAPITALTAISPEGSRVPLLDGLHRVTRPDVEELYGVGAERKRRHGLLRYFTLPAPSHMPEGWVFEMENAVGITTEAPGPPTMRDPIAIRSTIIAELARERSPDTELMDHVIPAVTRLQERLAESVEIERVEQFGSAPESPAVSIVVPLYQRVDLLEHQLAQFAGDPEIAESDLIYVLDSPELAGKLIADAAQLFELYQVPFRIAELSRNGGFSVANNAGAMLARGARLLLLNSDVLPTGPFWLGRLAEFYDSRPEAGAVGPKLLFDDGSIQHAGLYFRRPTASAAWENAHYFKGLHGDLPIANVTRPVPALTAACLMIDRDLYGELGGLRSMYVQGDYEDSDLCLRLRESGREPWYFPEVALYHLEGRSYATAARQVNARYNTWLHTRLWGEQIEALMAEEHEKGFAAPFP
jgi:GT2 family glycosyltransferase